MSSFCDILNDAFYGTSWRSNSYFRTLYLDVAINLQMIVKTIRVDKIAFLKSINKKMTKRASLFEPIIAEGGNEKILMMQIDVYKFYGLKSQPVSQNSLSILLFFSFHIALVII